MTFQRVTVVNNSNQTVSFLLDDEDDADKIAHFKSLERRGDLESVDIEDFDGGDRLVKPKRAPKATGRKPGPVPGTNKPAPVNQD